MSQWKTLGMGFYEKSGAANVGLCDLCIKNLDWRVKLLHTYNQGMESISSITRENSVFLSPEKVPVSALFFPLGNSALF